MNFIESILQKLIGKKMESSIKGNWKTTLAGICACVVLIFQEVGNLIDDNPETVFNWNNFWVLGIVALIGLFSKDGDKTSEDVGIK